MRRMMQHLGALLALVLAVPAAAQEKPLRIGVLTDLTGPLSGYFGAPSAEAARMAVEDWGAKVIGRPIEVVQADHQNKPDVGAAIAARWFDREDVELIVDVGNSAVALAVQNIAREKNKVVAFTGASSTALHGANCSPNGVQWGHDTYMFSTAVTTSLVKQGFDTWFLIVTDYAFGHQMQEAVSAVVTANGGKVLGSVRHPLNTADFSSYLLQAQTSKAKVVGLLNSVADLSNAIKQANEFRILPQQRLAALAFTEPDARGIGLQLAQGINFTTVFYWDRTDETRAFAERFYKRAKTMPTGGHAGDWSAITHYLKAVQQVGKLDGRAIVAAMKSMPVEDFYAGKATLRVDGRLLKDVYLMEVKSPQDSKREWDIFRTLQVIPADRAWRPLSEGGCPLAKP